MTGLGIVGIKTKNDAILFLLIMLTCIYISSTFVSIVQSFGYFPLWTSQGANVLSFMIVCMSIFLILSNIVCSTYAIASLFYRFPKVEGDIQSPLVSLLIPAHNEEKVISGIVTDLLKQTYKNIEVIVVAHNCYDRTAKVLKKIADPRLKVFKLNTKEMGKYLPLNFAAKKASGEIIGQFDADNRIKDPVMIEKAVRYFSDSSIDAIQGRLEAKNPDVNLLTKYQQLEFEAWSFIYWAGKNRLGLPSQLGGTNSFFRRSLLEKVSFWDDVMVEDFALYLKLSSIGAKIIYAPDVVSFDEKPITWSGAFRQRRRWVRGAVNLWRKWLFKKLSILDKIYLLLPLWIPMWYVATILSIGAYFYGPVVFWHLPSSVWISLLLLQYIFFYGVLKKRGVSVLYIPLIYVFSFHIFMLNFMIFASGNPGWRSTKTLHGEEA